MTGKVLIVDEEKWYMDAIFDRMDAEFGLGHYDYVFNGHDALELLKINNYSLIVLDMMLPLGGDLTLPEDEPDLMYGIYILRKIREYNKRIPVICYTILNEESIKNEIRDLHAIHLHKLGDRSDEKLFDEIKRCGNKV